jgi:hypothetical protein
MRGFWQLSSLEGFKLMVLTLPNPPQSNFFHQSDNEPASSSIQSNSVSKKRQVSFSEILTYALPNSMKVTEFSNLFQDIHINQKHTSLIERDDSKTAQAMILLSDILNENWQNFPLKVKVLLLNKLKFSRKSFWKSLIASFPTIFNTIRNRLTYYKCYWNELKTYDGLTQKSILEKVSSDSKLLRNAWFVLRESTLTIFNIDGCLLEENKDNIDRFNHSIKTMLSARQGMRDYQQTLIELAK